MKIKKQFVSFLIFLILSFTMMMVLSIACNEASVLTNTSTTTSSTTSSTTTTTTTIYFEDASDDINNNALWIAYNNLTKSSGNAANTTSFMVGGTLSGTLIDFDSGSSTGITVDVTYDNISLWSPPVTFDSSTDAYKTFDSILDLSVCASYNSSSVDGYIKVTFGGLDTGKKYAFITTANRSGSYDPDRYTKFTIMGADTYINISSDGVLRVSDDIVKINSGENTTTGYVAAWTNITASDGSFSVISQNVGTEGPGEQYKFYGMQGFKLVELP